MQSSLGVSPVSTGPSGVCVRCGDRCWLKFAALSEFGSGVTPDASGISKVSVWCLVSVRGNGYFSNGQEHRTLVWSIPDASGVN